jgi:hypothetical protein
VALNLAMLPAAMLFAVGLTRTLQASSMARRLALTGFSPADVLTGMRAVVDEREGLRAQLRLDPDTQRRRKFTLVSAVGMLVAAYFLMDASQLIGVSVGTGVNRVQTAGPSSSVVTMTPAARTTLAATGLSLLGVGLILLIRSPFRMSPGERLFRLIWLRLPGRLFLRLSMRGVATAPALAGNTRPVPAAPSAPAKSLEARVSELERWRRSMG